MVKKVISGGQTGADQGGLEAARLRGIPTGGFAPKGYKTEQGNALWLANYGLLESESPSYAARTAANVIASDGTVVFGDLQKGVGSKTTVACCARLKKPCLTNPTQEEFKRWLQENRISTLNVAGNRASKSPGIHDLVFRFLLEALK